MLLNCWQTSERTVSLFCIDRNYAELITPVIPVLEGQMRLFENRECFVDEDAKMETELDEILRELGMDPRGERREFRWLKEVILLAENMVNAKHGICGVGDLKSEV